MSKSARLITTTGNLTTDDVLDSFSRFLRLHTTDGDASPATIRTHHSQATQFVEWCQAQGIDPATVTEDNVIAYRKDLIDTGYSRSSIALKLSVVRRLYVAICWRGFRQDTPAAGIKAPKDRTSPNERVKCLQLDGLKRILAAPKGDSLQATRDRAMLVLMAVHGMRVAEVAYLRLEDINLSASAITVVGKGRKTRRVYLTEQTASVLSAWLDVRGNVALQDAPTVFVVVGNRATGTPITDRSIRSLVDGYLEALGLKVEGISCHALRHSAATWARASGASLDAIADMLGHSSTTTTQVYAQIVDKMNENPARCLGLAPFFGLRIGFVRQLQEIANNGTG